MVVAVFLMGFVATIACVCSAEIAEHEQVTRGVDHPTAKFWSWASGGCAVAALGLYGYWLFGVVL
jgi:hypothetical protein